jgi:branched-chain amino acid transport system substrate-binding protein
LPLASFTLGYKPQLVVSSVGIDPTTVGGLLQKFSKGKAGTELIQGAITSGYPPSVGETSNPWIALFKKVHERYDSSAQFDGNVEYGMANAYTLAQALALAGKSVTREGFHAFSAASPRTMRKEPGTTVALAEVALPVRL